jgi:hypothetical protein
MSNWDGVERRRTMDSEINSIKVELASFTAKVGQWMETTKEYRISLCDKFKEVKDEVSNLRIDFSKLPCKGRVIQSRLMWGALGIIFGIVVAHLGWK